MQGSQLAGEISCRKFRFHSLMMCVEGGVFSDLSLKAHHPIPRIGSSHGELSVWIQGSDITL